MRRIRVFDTVLKRWFWSDAPPKVSGFAAHLNSPVSISNSGVLEFDTLDFVSDDWSIDEDQGEFTTDGVSGLFLISCCVLFEVESGGPADEVWVDIEINSTRWNVDPITFNLQLAENSTSEGVWRGTVSTPLPLADECRVRAVVSRHPYGAMGTNVIQQSYLRAFKIGDDPEFV